MRRIGWVVVLLAVVSITACNTKAKQEAAKAKEAADSMNDLRKRGGTDLSNPEMGSKLIVRLSEYKLETVGETNIQHGQMTFAVENHGKLPHEFEVNGPSGTWKSGVIPPGSTILMSMILDKPGVHDIFSPSKTADKGADKDNGMASKVVVN